MAPSKIRSEIEIMTEAIILKYGKIEFTMEEGCFIVNVGVNTLPVMLHDAGILVKKSGKRKLVTAYNLAVLACINRESPVPSSL